jgi:hypothetical protein
MARGSKARYTDKQKRQAEHIEEGYEERGVGEPEAERRAWATVNKMTGGGRKSGSGRGQSTNAAPARKGGIGHRDDPPLRWHDPCWFLANDKSRRGHVHGRRSHAGGKHR